MPGFSLDSHELVCDGVPLSTIADRVGTPVYVYSAAVNAAITRAPDASGSTDVICDPTCT